MNLIICGGRDYQLTQDDYAWLENICKHHRVRMILSGGARGADAGGEYFARVNKIQLKRFSAAWAKHGVQAGPIRNMQMAFEGDAVAAFPGGKGTAHMVRVARERGLKVFMR